MRSSPLLPAWDSFKAKGVPRAATSCRRVKSRFRMHEAMKRRVARNPAERKEKDNISAVCNEIGRPTATN